MIASYAYSLMTFSTYLLSIAVANKYQSKFYEEDIPMLEDVSCPDGQPRNKLNPPTISNSVRDDGDFIKVNFLMKYRDCTESAT